jgi:hypothetical protein
MKHFFKQYSYRMLKHASPDGDPSRYDEERFFNHLARIAEESPNQILPYDSANVLCVVNTEHRLFNKKGEHIFVDEESEAVILNAIRKLTNKTLAEYKPEGEIGIIYRAKKEPILYNTYSATDPKSSVSHVESLGILRLDDFGKTEWTNRTVDSGLIGLQDNMRFIYGCFMMRECFPQVFQDGLPDYVKHPAWFRNQNNKSISIARVSHEVCPHIRVGHFRLLSSERFINKRGQVVFVKPSMVKGHATHTEKGEIHVENE